MERPPSSAGGDNATRDEQLRHAAGIQGDLQEGTRQKAADTFEGYLGADRIPLSTSLLGTGAQFDQSRPIL